VIAAHSQDSFTSAPIATTTLSFCLQALCFLGHVVSDPLIAQGFLGKKRKFLLVESQRGWKGRFAGLA
jgi:hypothetical protein